MKPCDLWHRCHMFLHSSEYVSCGKKTRPSSLCFHMLHSPDNCMFAHSKAENGQLPGLHKWVDMIMKPLLVPKWLHHSASMASWRTYCLWSSDLLKNVLLISPQTSPPHNQSLPFLLRRNELMRPPALQPPTQNLLNCQLCDYMWTSMHGSKC